MVILSNWSTPSAEYSIFYDSILWSISHRDIPSWISPTRPNWGSRLSSCPWIANLAPDSDLENLAASLLISSARSLSVCMSPVCASTISNMSRRAVWEVTAGVHGHGGNCGWDAPLPSRKPQKRFVPRVRVHTDSDSYFSDITPPFSFNTAQITPLFPSFRRIALLEYTECHYFKLAPLILALGRVSAKIASRLCVTFYLRSVGLLAPLKRFHI